MTDSPVTTAPPPEGEDAEFDAIFTSVWEKAEAMGNPEGLARSAARTVLWERLTQFAGPRPWAGKVKFPW